MMKIKKKYLKHLKHLKSPYTYLILIIALLIYPANALVVNFSSAHPIKVSADYVKISPDGKFAVCYNSSSVYAFNKSGIIWKKDGKASCIDIDKYVVVGENGEVLALALNGSTLWHKKVEGNVNSIATYSGFVVAGTDKGYVYYLNNTGGVVWKYNCKRYITNVGIKKDFVAVTDIDGNLYYFEKCKNLPWKYTAGDKTLAWMYETGWCVWKYEGIANSYTYPALIMSVTNKSVVLACENMKEVFCFSRDGYLEWVKSINDEPISISTSSNGEYIAVGCKNGDVYMFSGDNLLWKMDFKSPAFVSISPNGKYTAVGSGNAVYVLSSNGKLLWATYVESVKDVSISNNNIAVAGDDVYFITPNLESQTNTNLSSTNPSNISKTSLAAKASTLTTPTPTPTPILTPTPTPTPTPTLTPKPTPAKSSLPKYLEIIPIVAAVGVAGIILKKVKKGEKKKNKTKKTKTKAKVKSKTKNKTKIKTKSKKAKIENGKSKSKSKSEKAKKKALKRLEKAKKVV